MLPHSDCTIVIEENEVESDRFNSNAKRSNKKEEVVID
jgi:hypothetical protein